MKNRITNIIFLLLGCLLVLEGCGKHRVAEEVLLRADLALRAGEDSVAFEMLTAVEDSVVEEMGEAEGALYAVLVNQVLDRMDYELDDSLAQAAVEYYGNNGARDDYHEGLAYYYMGHILMRKNDISAIGWYSEAKECFKKSGDLRYEFLCWNYMGVVSESRRAIRMALTYYQNAKQVAERCNNKIYNTSSCVALFRCYGLIGAEYNDEEYTKKALAYQDSLGILQDLSIYDKIDVYEQLGVLALHAKDYSTALRYCDSTDALCHEYGRDNTYSIITKIGVLTSTNENKEAKRLLESLALKAEENLYVRAMVANNYSKIYTSDGMIDSAIVFANEYSRLRDSIDFKENNQQHDIQQVLTNRNNRVELFYVKWYIPLALVVLLGVFWIVKKYTTQTRIKELERQLEIQMDELEREKSRQSTNNIDMLPFLRLLGQLLVISADYESSATRQKMAIKKILNKNLLIGVSLLLKKSRNDGYTQAEYAKAFTTINSKVKIVMSGEVEDLKCKEQVHAIIEESIPSAIQTIMNKCPYLDEKDAVSLVMYWANLSSSMIGRVVFLSRGGAYKKLQNAIRRIEEEFGTKNMDEIIKNIFS
ncbi:MAG: hypothetical protein MJZ31_04375 [Bacteroidales bacterium]|nr:hypothetical protein [Bacteroidales bacterium]